MKKTDEELAAKIEKLRKRIEDELNEESPLSKMELSVEEEKRKLGQRMMDEKLNGFPVEDGQPRPCPKCKMMVNVRAKNVPRTFRSLSGEHSFRRNYHYCNSCNEGFYPRDAEIGLPKDAEVSDEMAKRLADFFLNDPYETAEERWTVHYPHTPVSSNQFRQEAERIGEKLEFADESVLASALQPLTAAKPDILYVQNDGTMVSMRGKLWREVKGAVIFSSEKHCRRTKSKRGKIMGAHYVAVLGDQEAFIRVLRPTLKVANMMKAKRVVWIADGAKGNWLLARRMCPLATHILDWFHAIEHASDCAKVLFGDADPCVKLFVNQVEQLLRTGQLKQCLKELRQLIEMVPNGQPLKAVTELIRYYRENQCRMQYDRYLADGLLIGSGPIEAAHRHVIQTRMKKAGQHWGERGGRCMARMRAAYRTAGPERFLKAINWAYRETRTYGRLPKPLKRRASNR